MLRRGLATRQTVAFRDIYRNRKIRPLLGACRDCNVMMLQCDKMARSVLTTRPANGI